MGDSEVAGVAQWQSNGFVNRCSAERTGSQGALPDEAKFWARVDRSQLSPGGCWPWMGARNGDGYGVLGFGERGRTKFRTAHRTACELEHGPPPFPGARALHSCDWPPCCNSAHLRWGTQADNVADQVARGRHRNFGAYGKYQCGLCGERGHNARACGTPRAGADTRRRRKATVVANGARP